MVINHISLLFQLQLERVDGCTLQLGLKLSLYFPCCWMQRLRLFPDNRLQIPPSAFTLVIWAEQGVTGSAVSCITHIPGICYRRSIDTESSGCEGLRGQIICNPCKSSLLKEGHWEFLPVHEEWGAQMPVKGGRLAFPTLFPFLYLPFK